MDDVLSAGSPVEIDAKAEAAGLAETDRDAALALFHDLTSRLELTLLETRPMAASPGRATASGSARPAWWTRWWRRCAALTAWKRPRPMRPSFS